MHLFSASLSRRLLTGTLLVAVTLALQAQSGAERGETGGIAAAQREFQALRAAEKVRGDEVKLRLPDVTAPELRHTAPPAIMPGRERDKPGQIRGKKQPSDNWLVDAMMQEPVDPDEPKAWSDEEDSNEPQDPFAELIAETLRPAPKADTKNEAVDRDSPRDQRVIEAPNPFAIYMSAWISPQHRDLLLPQREAGAPVAGRTVTAGIDGFTGAPPAQSSPAAATGPEWSGMVTRGPSGQGFTGESNHNPFLAPEDFTLPSVLPPMAPPSGVPSPLPAVPEPVRPRSEPPPALAKPADDAKYFPQLKRF